MYHASSLKASSQGHLFDCLALCTTLVSLANLTLKILVHDFPELEALSGKYRNVLSVDIHQVVQLHVYTLSSVSRTHTVSSSRTLSHMDGSRHSVNPEGPGPETGILITPVCGGCF